MSLIDMHCDTIWKLMRDGEGVSLSDNKGSIDMQGMKDAGTMAQFFACFIYMKEFEGAGRFTKGYYSVFEMVERLRKEIDATDAVEFAASCKDIEKNQKDHKISAVLTVEEGGVLDSDMARLEKLYETGIRLITFTWNEENCIGYPNSRDSGLMDKGLKPFGMDVVREMNEMGMIIDVSHLSDGGFRDVLSISKKPVAASHSNARAVCNHPRNLSDEMIRILASKGGVMGLNFYPYFLNSSGKASLEDMVSHVKHIIKIGGSEVLAIGSDFDGYDEGESELTHVSQMNRLKDALESAKITGSQIDKIWEKNALRLINEVW